MDNLTNHINALLPGKQILVPNDMLPTIKQALTDYQHAMLKQPSVKIEAAQEGHSTVSILDFNDNDLMLFGYYFYRTMLTTKSILSA